MRKDYASRLTREDLFKHGITFVDPEILTVYGRNGYLWPHPNKAGYLMITVYDFDENGDRIKVPAKHRYTTVNGEVHESDSYAWKTIDITLNRVLWAWVYGEVPKGFVVDHINNEHRKLEDYRLDNLQLLTPGENIAKERNNLNSKVIKCHRKPLEYYEKKLISLSQQYEAAKFAHNAKLVHRLRSNISNVKARIRYLVRQNNEIQQLSPENNNN